MLLVSTRFNFGSSQCVVVQPAGAPFQTISVKRLPRFLAFFALGGGITGLIILVVIAFGLYGCYWYRQRTLREDENANSVINAIDLSTASYPPQVLNVEKNFAVDVGII